MNESLKLLKDATGKAEELTKALNEIDLESISSDHQEDCYNQAYYIRYRLRDLVDLIEKKFP